MSITLFRGDCLDVLPTWPEASVQLILTSPQYNVGWSYADDDGAGDRLPLADYLAGLERALAAMYRVLRPGGVLALNLPATIRTPEHRGYPLSAWAQMHLLKTGWLQREVVVWVKAYRTWNDDSGSSAYSTSTAIGGPRNPYLRPCHESVILASKETYSLPGKDSKRWPGGSGEFGRYLECAKDVWLLPPGRAGKGEPLAFPDGLVVRAVELYSNAGDVVADPFTGTGTVGRVARSLGREAWLVEREPAFWPRLEALVAQRTLDSELVSVSTNSTPPAATPLALFSPEAAR